MCENQDVKIEIPKDELEAFCRRNRIRRLALFGSVLRDDFTPESDIDVLVEFEPDAKVGWSFFAMQDELGKLLGREVDLNTAGFLSPSPVITPARSTAISTGP